MKIFGNVFMGIKRLRLKKQFPGNNLVNNVVNNETLKVFKWQMDNAKHLSSEIVINGDTFKTYRFNEKSKEITYIFKNLQPFRKCTTTHGTYNPRFSDEVFGPINLYKPTKLTLYDITDLTKDLCIFARKEGQGVLEKNSDFYWQIQKLGLKVNPEATVKYETDRFNYSIAKINTDKGELVRIIKRPETSIHAEEKNDYITYFLNGKKISEDVQPVRWSIQSS